MTIFHCEPLFSTMNHDYILKSLFSHFFGFDFIEDLRRRTFRAFGEADDSVVGVGTLRSRQPRWFQEI